jgi:hypothetical protein
MSSSYRVFKKLIKAVLRVDIDDGGRGVSMTRCRPKTLSRSLSWPSLTAPRP